MTNNISHNYFLDLFPFPSFRKYQYETIYRIKKAFDSGKKFVVVEAPTGSGKSPIALTFCHIYKSSYILTPQKILQDQYMNDFGDEIVDLKGRSNYICRQNNSPCVLGICKMAGKAFDPSCNVSRMAVSVSIKSIKCPYHKRIREAQVSQVALFNFKSFLYQTALGRFNKRELLIIDECHNTERELVDILAVKITENQLKPFRVPLPNSLNVSDCLNRFDRYNLIQKLRAKIEQLKDEKQYAKAEKLSLLLIDIKFLQNPANEAAKKFVVDHEEYRNPVTNQVTKSILFRPLYIKNWSNRLFHYGEKVLMMSATVLNYKLVVENLGISLKDSQFIQVKSTFPKQNRPIIINPTGFMTYNHIDKTLPQMAKAIDSYLCKYKNYKGIIYTHSFKILNFLKDTVHILDHNKKRLLFQNDFETRELMIEAHKYSLNSVIVAPAMHEGLDLKDDLSRFQIICKVPYPASKGDTWMTRRTKDSWRFYVWMTALKLVQSYGRSVRSVNDKAITIVLDSQFEKFMKQSKYVLPEWFKEAALPIPNKRLWIVGIK